MCDYDKGWEDGCEYMQAEADEFIKDLLEACQMALKVFHLDSDMEEDFAPEISALTEAINKAKGG